MYSDNRSNGCLVIVFVIVMCLACLALAAVMMPPDVVCQAQCGGDPGCYVQCMEQMQAPMPALK